MENQNIKKFVSYFRVSTKKQGVSRLGLESQKSISDKYVSQNGICIAEFTEIESGKNDNREQLEKAIELCKKENAVLLIAKLDRLSRKLSFISLLMDSDLEFVCCDFPTANKLTLSVLAAVAQNERESISERVRLSNIERRKRGAKMGKTENLTSEGRKLGVKKIKENARKNKQNRQATELICLYIDKGLSYNQIAAKLNDLGMKTRKDKAFFATTVMRLYKRNE